jgi:hypothetical protein
MRSGPPEGGTPNLLSPAEDLVVYRPAPFVASRVRTVAASIDDAGLAANGMHPFRRTDVRTVTGIVGDAEAMINHDIPCRRATGRNRFRFAMGASRELEQGGRGDELRETTQEAITHMHDPWMTDLRDFDKD